MFVVAVTVSWYNNVLIDEGGVFYEKDNAFWWINERIFNKAGKIIRGKFARILWSDKSLDGFWEVIGWRILFSKNQMH